MPKRFGTSVFLSWLLLVFGVTGGLGQVQDLDELRTHLDGLQKKADALLMERIQNENAISELAAKINILKSKSSLKLPETDQLDDLLKKTVAFKKNSDAITNEMHALQQKRKAGINKLIKLLEDELATVGEQIRITPDKKSSEHYLKLLQEKKRLNREIAGFESFFTPQIEASPNDDYKTLYLKADFLSDQADKLNAFLKMLTKKIGELEEEKEIRELTNNFVSHVFIFDDDKELKFSTAGASSKPGSKEVVEGETTENFTESVGTAGGHSGSSGFSDDLQVEEIGGTVNLGKESVLINLDQISMSSSEDMALVINQLNQETVALRQQIDFLIEKAGKLYKMAKELENELDD